jgi:G6PDH family F420-dependent oxidoreductase
VRLEMLAEAVELIRLLHSGQEVSFHGRYYQLSDARIYTLPAEPVPIHVSGFGPQATELAGRIGDGFCTIGPDAATVELFRKSGGAGKPVQGGLKVCWAPTEGEGVETAHRLWPNELLGGQLAQVMPRPQDFEAACEPVTREAVAEHTACGPDVERHIEVAKPYLDAGFDQLYVSQIGTHHEEFFRVWRDEVLPALRAQSAGEHA